MQKFSYAFVATALSLAFGSMAFAADLPPATKAPALAPAPFSWTGFYIGGHAGYGWADMDASIASSPFFFDTAVIGLSGDGFVGGAQIGYNWHFAPNWLIGIEGDISGANIDSKSTAPMTAMTVPLPLAGHGHAWNISMPSTRRIGMKSRGSVRNADRPL